MNGVGAVLADPSLLKFHNGHMSMDWTTIVPKDGKQFHPFVDTGWCLSMEGLFVISAGPLNDLISRFLRISVNTESFHHHT